MPTLNRKKAVPRLAPRRWKIPLGRTLLPPRLRTSNPSPRSVAGREIGGLPAFFFFAGCECWGGDWAFCAWVAKRVRRRWAGEVVEDRMYSGEMDWEGVNGSGLFMVVQVEVMDLARGLW